MTLQVGDCIRGSSAEIVAKQVGDMVRVGDLWAINVHNPALGTYERNVNISALVTRINITEVESWPGAYYVSVEYWDTLHGSIRIMSYRQFMDKGHWRMCRV
jgi:hypothetical protein